jgi:HSP90 family molecular chaperone
MEEYIVVDQILPNYLEVGDLIKVKHEVFEVLNLKDTVDGWDIVVLDNYQETKIISVPEGKLINLTMLEDNI